MTMTPFSIAGIQMPVSAGTENVTAMAKRLDVLMLRFPWVQMAVFSELCAFGRLPKNAQPTPGRAGTEVCEVAAHHRVWLLTGRIVEHREGGGSDPAPLCRA